MGLLTHTEIIGTTNAATGLTRSNAFSRTAFSGVAFYATNAGGVTNPASLPILPGSNITLSTNSSGLTIAASGGGSAGNALTNNQTTAVTFGNSVSVNSGMFSATYGIATSTTPGASSDTKPDSVSPYTIVNNWGFNYVMYLDGNITAITLSYVSSFVIPPSARTLILHPDESVTVTYTGTLKYFLIQF
jgi:hypothetical protein